MKDPADRPRFVEAMTVLAATLNEPMSEARLAGYWLALNDLDVEAVEGALVSLLRSAKFFPKPAEIREVIAGSPDDKAALAWGRLLYAIEVVGPWQSVTFEDSVLHAVIDVMGGWAEMWQLERMALDDLGYREAEFRRLYTALSRRLPCSPPAHLPGQHELNNARNGWRIEPPVVIPGLLPPRVAVRVLPPVPPSRRRTPAVSRPREPRRNRSGCVAMVPGP